MFNKAITSEVEMASGGDFIVDMFDQNSKSHTNNQAKVRTATGGYEELPQIHRKSMDDEIKTFRKDYSFV